MSQRKWRRVVSGSAVTRSSRGSSFSENRHAQVMAALHPSATQLHVRGKGNLCWNMVFYGKHLASKKHTNPFHAFYLTGGNCGERHLTIGKDVLLMPWRSRVTSFKFFGTMAFFPQLPWLLFPLHWRHAPGWDLTLSSWVPGESSPWRVGGQEESAKCWRALVGFLSVRGGAMVFGFGLLHVGNL